MSSQDEVLFEELKGKQGNVGLITLHRPQVLNTLTFNMCKLMNETLARWEQADNIKAVIIRGAGDKAFCAGGDIRTIYELGKHKKLDEALRFFKEEYQLNARIYNFPKPYIALLDGITMGGGMGVSIHGNFKIATERMVMAMPETGIGFFPDIGASYFLSRCTDEIGTYLALTGAHINAADAAYLNLVDALVSSTHCQDIIDSITMTPLGKAPNETIRQIMRDFAVIEESTALKLYRDSIQNCFKEMSIESIIEHLKKYKSEFHEKTLAQFKGKSPTSLKVTLAQLRKGVGLNFKRCLQMEYNMVNQFLKHHDFYEGVRALLIDKDKTPKWKPSTLDKVSKEQVESYFEPADGVIDLFET